MAHKFFFQIQTFYTFNLLLERVTDIFWLVNHDSSPSPRLPFCPLFPVEVLSICLCGSNVPVTTLLVSEPPYKAWAESKALRELYQLFPFIYTDS